MLVPTGLFDQVHEHDICIYYFIVQLYICMLFYCIFVYIYPVIYLYIYGTTSVCSYGEPEPPLERLSR